ncbi:hypothetical protein D9V37_18955 [Nocardioides mangrovicus]|uniref:DUF6457 domain-containing protein n=1 Tax=Nocardioides mangrovicus TaxID=2478913 RepID=A0A3L8NZR0_9ACTN|nr:DUF6457 domain-containing protein [Nocardioides mangrovicus]RLV48157.1 hypothetical protein D9V37_18955 [Nocardioides mangrovicus]
MNLHDWIDELCDALDIEVDVDEALVLDLARDAAHNVERAAAPITTFLLGYAAAAHDGDQDELERMAQAATDLAMRWDKPGEGAPGGGDDTEEPGETGDTEDTDDTDLDDLDDEDDEDDDEREG